MVMGDLSDRSGQIGRFEPMQPVMIQQTHNYQARMVSWLEDVGRFAHFFLAKGSEVFSEMICVKMIFKFYMHLHVDSVNPQFPYFWFMFHDASAEKEPLGQCHVNILCHVTYLPWLFRITNFTIVTMKLFFYHQPPECVPSILESNKEVWLDFQSFRRVPLISR